MCFLPSWYLENRARKHLLSSLPSFSSLPPPLFSCFCHSHCYKTPKLVHWDYSHVAVWQNYREFPVYSRVLVDEFLYCILCHNSLFHRMECPLMSLKLSGTENQSWCGKHSTRMRYSGASRHSTSDSHPTRTAVKDSVLQWPLRYSEHYSRVLFPRVYG